MGVRWYAGQESAVSFFLFFSLLGSWGTEIQQRVSQRVLSKGVAWLENFLFFLKITSRNLQVLLGCTHLKAGGSFGKHKDSGLRHCFELNAMLSVIIVFTVSSRSLKTW